MPSKYIFSDYSQDWPLEFARESERLQSLLGSELIAIHHIGSTSVTGLPAKSIIDLLPVVQDLEAIDRKTKILQEAGYKAWGEYGLPGRRYFTKDQGENRTRNIHIYQRGDPDIERHLAFCAYLRFHEEVRDEYAAFKQKVYALHPDDITAYNDGKNDWIKKIEPIAIEWYRRKEEK